MDELVMYIKYLIKVVVWITCIELFHNMYANVTSLLQAIVATIAIVLGATNVADDW
jgi:hypothetical protein